MMPNKRWTTVLLICFLILLTAPFIIITEAEAGGYPWKNHAKPFDFLFGHENNIRNETYNQRIITL